MPKEEETLPAIPAEKIFTFRCSTVPSLRRKGILRSSQKPESFAAYIVATSEADALIKTRLLMRTREKVILPNTSTISELVIPGYKIVLEKEEI